MNIYQKSINCSRYLAATAISNAKSGHTGSCVGAADILFTLMRDHLFFNPTNPDFENRDRLVLSAGHVAPLYYSLLAMFGYNVTTSDLKNLRKFSSSTPGHPEVNSTLGVDCSTGPLGQGVANAVGLAIGAKYQAEVFNTVSMQLFDNYTYCFVGDGCLSEGVALEAISLAGQLKLNKLILLYDCNEITLDGPLSESNTENVKQKFISQNWNVISDVDGNNYKKITKAIDKAKRSEKPTIIIFKTKIGFGTQFENSHKAHGSVLSKEQLLKLKETLAVDFPDFFIPDDVTEFCQQAIVRNKEKYETWHENFFLFEKTHPELFKLYNQFINPKPIDFSKVFAAYLKEDRQLSGRDANHEILCELSKRYTSLIGGSADLASSTKVFVDNGGIFGVQNYQGRNIRFGVREHAMAAICNGISLYSGFIPFYSTFLTFSNYMLPALRMSAMMGLKQLVFLSHDGLLVGADGPSHQPVEQIPQLRLIPNLSVFRPANISELLGSYSVALSQDKPSAIILSKSEMLSENKGVKDMSRGAYVFDSDDGEIDVVIYSSGIDMKLARQVQRSLRALGKKVALVSVPCFELLDKQTQAQRKASLLLDVDKKVVIECTNDPIWYKYLSNDILMINNTKYGKSGDGKTVYQKYGFNEKAIVSKILDFLKN